MIISIIAAMAVNRVIGREGRLPWDLPLDRRRFRELTWGHPVIMGRATFQSLGRPLPGRRNIVLSRQKDFSAEGCLVVHDLPAALDAAAGADEVFIGGGAAVYREALPLAGRIYLTVVRAEMDGDTFFPEIPTRFVPVEQQTVPDTIPCDYILYERR